MGVVYEAVHAETNERAALKTVRVPRAEHVQGVRREVMALARLSHPGIVRIVGEGLHDGLPWYAMDLVAGETLRSWARRLRDHGDSLEEGATTPTMRFGLGEAPTARIDIVGDARPSRQRPVEPLPPELIPEVLSLSRDLCNALAYLHGEGIVHRDLKLDNVLLREAVARAPGDAALRPVIVDFGLAARFAAVGRDALEVQGEITGSVDTIAPEQARGDLIDARADLYSLGCMIYELLVGRPPFVGASATDVVVQHLSSEPVPPSRYGLPRELDDIVLRLLEKTPARRLGSALALAARLERILAAGNPPGTSPRPTEARRADERATAAARGAGLPVCRPHLYRSPLVARDDALAVLGEALDDLGRQRGRIVIASGPSGSGKTRLGLELSRQAVARGYVVLTAHGGERPGSRPLRGLPLQGIADICREGGAPETLRILGARAATLAPYEPGLAALPGLEDLPPAANLAADAARLRVFVHARDVLEALAVPRPVVWILDDLHLADELTTGTVAYLARAGAPPAVMVLASYRSEDAGPDLQHLGGGDRATALHLGRLSPDAVSAMAGHMLGLLEPPADLGRLLAARAEGNPLFVAECLRALVDEGTLALGRDGEWTSSAIGDIPLPGSIETLLARRLTALGPGARRLAAIASVQGRRFEEEVLAATAELDAASVRVGLAELLARDVLEGEGSSFAFQHDGLHRAAYEALDPAERRIRHGAVAGALEAGGRATAAELAPHWERAGERARASGLYLDAGDAAAAQFALQAAEQAFRSCLALSGGPSTTSANARLHLSNRVLRLQGHMDEARDVLSAALEDALRIDEPVLAARCRLNLGVVLHKLGKLNEARATIEASLSEMERAGDRHGEADALNSLGTYHLDRGELASAVQCYEKAGAIHGEDGDALGRATVLGNIGVVLFEQSRFEDARGLFAEAYRVYGEHGDVRGLGRMLGCLASLDLSQGRLAEASRDYETTLVLARRTGDRLAEGIAIANLANVAHERGDLVAALPLYESSIATTREIGDRRTFGTQLGNLALLHHELGDTVRARALFDESLSVLREIGDRRFEAISLGNMARLLDDEGDREGARRLFADAAERHQTHGDRRSESIVCVSWARLERRAGSLDRAGELLDAARDPLERSHDRSELARWHVEHGLLELARGDGGAARGDLAAAGALVDGIDFLPGSAIKTGIAQLAAAIGERC